MPQKLIWITGGSGGIGAALAREYARKGYRIILSARRKEALERSAEECRRAGAAEVNWLLLDMTDEKAIAEQALEVEKKWGTPDVLINNAGISQRSRVIETEMSVYHQIFAVDFFGAVALTKALLPGMLARKSGQVVAVSSLTGKFSTPYRSGYAAAKHALHGFFDALRAEHFEDGLTVSLICPGFVHTQISVNALTGTGEPLQKMDRAQAEGMPAEALARKAVKALEAGRAETLIGGKERYGVLISRFFPALFRKIIRKAKVH